MREKVVGKTPGAGPLARARTAAAPLAAGRSRGRPEWETLDPPQRRLRILDAVKQILLRESQGQPLVLIFEDLHWIDGESQALLDSLVDSLPTARVLLVVSYRPEYRHGWASKAYYTQLRLDTLPQETAEQLLDSLLGSDASLLPLRPFFRSGPEATHSSWKRASVRWRNRRRSPANPGPTASSTGSTRCKYPPPSRHCWPLGSIGCR